MNDDEALAEQTEREVEAAVARLDEERARHEETVAESAARVAAAAEGLARGLARYKAALDLVGRAFPMALARVLYWEHPDVKAAQIAKLIGVGESSVYALMGEYTITRECRGHCGRMLSRKVRNRSQAKGGGLSWRWCDECAAERDRRSREVQARWDASDESAAHAFEQAVAAGVKPSRVYVELPGVPGTWRVDPDEYAVAGPDEGTAGS